MKHLSALLLFMAILAVACSPKTAPTSAEKSAPAVPKVTYAADISPLLLGKCAPCHYPAQNGKKEALDTYEAAQKHINAVISRVELPQDDPRFMPFKMKKPALTPDEITLLKNWARGGFAK